MKKEDWNLANIPPEGDPDVADFAFTLFQASKAEKDRLGKPKDFLNNYALYRGQQAQQTTAKKGTSSVAAPATPINLYFANIERTVSNITARNPVGEVVDLDGITDDAEKAISMRLKKWWKETDQLLKIRSTARMMEIYGITTESPCWNFNKKNPDIKILDPYGFFPAPGYWEKIDEEAPYICLVYLDLVSNVESFYDVTNIANDDAYDLLGTEREKYKNQGYGTPERIGNYSDAMTVRTPTNAQSIKQLDRCLVIEVWLRDGRTKSTEQKVIDAEGNPVLHETGHQLIEQVTEPMYPDGIRKITIAKSNDPQVNGYVVLDDSANPNINPNIDVELAQNTYPWGRLPCYHANSYKDGVSIWGFAAAEQVGDLHRKINLIFSKLIAWVINVMTPPLIVQKNCGITREMIVSTIQQAGRLILMPTIPNARIEFMQVPNLPQTFFTVLEFVVRFFDRVYQIEDADRGVAPSGVIAASAIVALQERNQVLMQTKTAAIDMIAEQRSRWAIGLFQNWGTSPETVNVNNEPVEFIGVTFVGRKFNYVVESGSTMPRTSLQLQELAFKLWDTKAIGQKGLLETLNWPDWKGEIERTAESQVDQALQILIDAGLPEEYAVQVKQFVLQSSEQFKNQEGGKQ